jgi:thiol-disulfide isomerase/thioredoxin
MYRTAAVWAVVLAGVLAAGCGGNGDDSAKPKPSEAAKADQSKVLFRFDQFKTALLVDGGELALSSLQGKVVLLDLFGTWCPPCRKAIPFITSLYERFHDAGLEVVGLAFERVPDVEQACDSVKVFRERFAIPYTLALGSDVVWEELRARTGAEGEVPTILLMDKQRIVRYVYQGLQPGDEAKLAELIEQLLAEPAGTLPK